MDNLDKRIQGLSPAKRALLELRLKQGDAGQSRVASIAPRPNHQSARLSFAQQRLWLLDQLETNGALYNVPRALRLEGNLNIDALQRALNQLARRHETLRTHFEVVEAEVRQMIVEDAHLPLQFIDLRDLPVAEKEARARQLSQEEAAKPFDLRHGPLMRACLLRLGAREHILLLTNHHIISDAWSGGILYGELSELYNAFVSGMPSSLQPLTIQYADFAEWQRNSLQHDELQRQLGYWKKQLVGVTSILDLPTDFPRSSALQSRGSYKFVTLTKELTGELKELSKREGATLFMTLMAAFQIILWRYSGQTNFIIGSPIAGRNRVEIENLIGFFINTLALRADLSSDSSFRALLKQVRETALGAYAHQDLPFEKLVEELHPERDLGRNPLFQVMFQFQNAASPVFQMKDLNVSLLDVSTDTAKFDLMLAAREEDDALVCVMEYSTELFAGATIERILKQFSNLLAAIAAQPDERVSRLPLMTEAEQRQIVHEWNDTVAEFPREQGIHELFEEQVALTPDAMALIAGSEHITFRELNQRANQLARYLRRQHVGPEVRVAICVERSIDMIVGLLGIMKAGGVYVPLEPNYPPERLSFIVEDSQAALILTQQHLRASLSGAPIVCFDEIRAELAAESTADVASGVTPTNAAHVIYTSGSTGQPKGVISSHSASVNRFAWMWRHYPFGPDEVCCQKTALSFVDSIWEIFGPLLQGVRLVIIPDEVVKDSAQFVDALSAGKVTRLVLVPSLLRAMLEGADNLAQTLEQLRICVCSGEALPRSLTLQFSEKLPRAKLINLYGASELAADVTCFEATPVHELTSVPIGRPIANTQVYILDAELQPAAVNIPGEIFVGGEGLARGYLNRPDLTAERFIPDPFAMGQRLFRTGDAGRYLPEGNIEYRGRLDHQVKMRGFRIELGEVETALLTHARVTEAVVMLRNFADHRDGDGQLVAYVVAEGEAPAASDLRAYLRQKLPEFMIPSTFVMLAEMPLTASGKVNRLALPEAWRGAAAEDFIAPRTATEDVLANIWAAELNLNAVGVNDDFFALGGHSLLLARIATRIRKAFEIELPLRVLFEAATVAALADRIESIRWSGEAPNELPLVRGSRAGDLPLSFAQERLWFFDQLEPGSAAYNIPRALRLTGPLDRNALQQSLAAIHARHEVLRSIFQNVNGKPVLSFSEAETPGIPMLDLTELAAAEREAAVNIFVKEETARPFDLTRGPLLRLALAKLDEEDHVLVLTMHHIVSDGWSIGIALGELVAGYNAVVGEDSPPLHDLPVQYADFAAWQRQYLSGPVLEKQLEFWRAELRDSPVLINLPTDRPRPPLRSFHGARQAVSISTEPGNALKEIARSERATLFMTLLTAFQLLLACLSGDDDIVVGSPTAGRNRPETENLIGYFVNTVVLRTKVAGDPSFREVLRHVRDTALKAFAHQDMPFEKLVDEFGSQRSLEYNPLFQVWFVLQNVPGARQQWHGLKVEHLDIETSTTRHDLQLTLWETAAGLEGAFTFSTELFNAETIARVAEQFRALLAAVVAQPEISLSDLRARLSEVGLAFQQQRAEHLMESSRERLRSAKRRAVSADFADYTDIRK